MVEVGDIIMYFADDNEKDTIKDDVGIVTKLTPSGTKAAVLWTSETAPLYFAVGDLNHYPKHFKLVKKQG